MTDGSSEPAVLPVDRKVGNPIVTVATIMYASYALLAIAIPQSVVNWVKDLDPGPAQDVMLAVAESIEAMSGRLGSDIPYRTARRAFLRATGKSED